MGNDKHIIKGMMKAEYSRLANIPPSTLANYMNKLYISDLAAMEYHTHQKHLTPRQVAYLNQKLVVTLSDF